MDARRLSNTKVQAFGAFEENGNVSLIHSKLLCFVGYTFNCCSQIAMNKFSGLC